MSAIRPKDIQLRRIHSRDAKRIIIENYHAETFPSGVKLCLGCFVGGRCLGTVVYSIGSRFIFTVIEDGKFGDVWELSRLWLSDELPKNSESRVLSVAMKMVRKHNPKLIAAVTYTTLGVGLYKGAGWLQVPGRFGDRQRYVVDGVEHFSSRAVANKYGTISKEELRKRGHVVVMKPAPYRTKWIYWLREGKLSHNNNSKTAVSFEKEIVRLWRQAPKWLGWPGTETIRKAITDESYVTERNEAGMLVGIWLVSRLRKMRVFRGIGCCVDKQARGQGVGRRLCEKMKAACDAESRMLTFDCKAANPAIGFWRHNGFQETGTRKRGNQQELYRRFVYIPKQSAPVVQG